MTSINWAEMAARDFNVSAEQATEYLPEALKLLTSADPHERDGIAYPALATWLEAGLLDNQLAQIGDEATQLFQHPEVYARSFAALLLAEVLARDTQTRELTPENLRQCQQQWADWYLNEKDLRSHTPELGWLHALAHGADVASVLALHPALSSEDLNAVLGTLLQRLQVTGSVPIQYEDDRLAMAAFLLLTRPQLTQKDWQHWLERLGEQLAPAWGQPRLPATAFAVQFARALLMFTHYGAKLPNGTVIPASEADHWRAALLETLRKAFFFAYPE